MIYSRFAVEEGNESNINANGNYLITPKNFIVKPTAGEVFNVTRMIVSITDSGLFSSAGYGAASALTNGLSFEIWKRGLKDFCLNDQLPIKQNGEYQALNHDLILSTFGAGNSWMSIRYTFTRDTNNSQGVILDGANGDEFRVVCNDDLTGLVGHYFRFGINLIDE